MSGQTRIRHIGLREGTFVRRHAPKGEFRGARPRGPEADEQQHQHADAKQQQRLYVHDTDPNTWALNVAEKALRSQLTAASQVSENP
jgi:hypothetical protein